MTTRRLTNPSQVLRHEIPKVLEATVKAAVKKRLREIGCYQFWPVQMGLGTTTLDCIGCYQGRFFAIETKRPGLKMTMAQERVAEEMTRHDGVVLLIDTVEKAKSLTPDDLIGRST